MPGAYDVPPEWQACHPINDLKRRQMAQCNPIASDERIVDAMIQLARATKSRRIIVAGAHSAEVFLELHRRGYPLVTTTKTCRIPCAQHDVALVVSADEPNESIEATLNRLVDFLSAAGTLAIWTGSHERAGSRKIRLALVKLGFRIEAGTSCEKGVVIAARRLSSAPAAKAA
jgi:hypothetical protein